MKVEKLLSVGLNVITCNQRCISSVTSLRDVKSHLFLQMTRAVFLYIYMQYQGQVQLTAHQ